MGESEIDSVVTTCFVDTRIIDDATTIVAELPNNKSTRHHTIKSPIPSLVKEIETEKILRFQKSERLLHWSITIPFLLCFLSGWVLKAFYNLDESELTSRIVFGWTHRIAGALLIGLPLTVALTNIKAYKIHLYNIKVAWSWTIADIKWLMLMGLAAVSKKIVLPEQRKFNAAEKLNFMMVMCTYPIFILSGLVLWIEGNIYLVWLVHFVMILVATPFVLGHIYMALINPSTRIGLSGMITGNVSREWAKHHYANWYREHFEPSK